MILPTPSISSIVIYTGDFVAINSMEITDYIAIIINGLLYTQSLNYLGFQLIPLEQIDASLPPSSEDWPDPRLYLWNYFQGSQNYMSSVHQHHRLTTYHSIMTLFRASC